MPLMILEAVERELAEDLLRTADIYNEYADRTGNWVNFIRDFSELTRNYLKDENGAPVVYTPVQQVRDSLPFIIPSAERLLALIRRLRFSETFEIIDLYSRLESLDIRKIDQPDHKGLFLLAAKAAEDNGVFHE